MPSMFKISFHLIFPILEFVRVIWKGAMEERCEKMQREFLSSINMYLHITLWQNSLSFGPSSGKLLWASLRPVDKSHRVSSEELPIINLVDKIIKMLLNLPYKAYWIQNRAGLCLSALS